tara:strand:- start:918 stop:1604 length:687 start_codon:yes stop_codon:yes gene_type:complete
MNSLENLTTSNSVISGTSIFVFALNLLISLILSLFLVYLYGRYGRSLSNKREFANNFSLITMTTMIIITIVKSSLALSLGLVGALSIVRFRTAIKEPEELSYIFLCIAIGLGLGANQRIITIVGFLIISGYLILRSKYYKKSSRQFMNIIVSLENSKDDSLEETIKIINKKCKSTSLRRLTHNTDNFESVLTAEINSFNDLINMRKELYEKYPDISIDFIDNPGLMSD